MLMNLMQTATTDLHKEIRVILRTLLNEGWLLPISMINDLNANWQLIDFLAVFLQHFYCFLYNLAAYLFATAKAELDESKN